MIACPDEEQFARGISEGPGADLLLHLADCATCRATWDGMTRVIDLARKIPIEPQARDRREELRTAILAMGERTPAAPRGAPVRRARVWLAGAGVALAAAAAIVLLVRPRAQHVEIHSHGTVTAAGGARYVLASTSPDEIVVLADGVIDVEVSPLDPGERFRVITADGEIEVRGTAFSVESHLGHIAVVRVRHGLVEVRPLGGPIARIGAGQAWTAPALRTAAAEIVPPPPPVISAQIAAPERATPARIAAPRRPARAAITERVDPVPAAPTAVARSPQAMMYDQAWAAMRANNFAAASSAFVRATVLDPEGALAEDASYWYPVALARAKRSEAVTAFRDFLERYPRSAHAHEASAMLGWLLVDANQKAEAERRFRAAADDTRPDVRDSARAGLKALGL